MGRDARRAKQARRDRRRRTDAGITNPLHPDDLLYDPERFAPDLTAEPVMLHANVHQDVAADDGTTSPWAAVVHPVEVPEDAKVTTADTLPVLFRRVQQTQEDLADYLDRPVATVWALDGDTAAWQALAAEHGLDEHQTDHTVTVHH